MSDNNNADFIDCYGQKVFMNLLSFLNNNNKLYVGLRNDCFSIMELQIRENNTVDIRAKVIMMLSEVSENDTVLRLDVERINIDNGQYIQWHIRNDL